MSHCLIELRLGCLQPIAGGCRRKCFSHLVPKELKQPSNTAVHAPLRSYASSMRFLIISNMGYGAELPNANGDESAKINLYRLINLESKRFILEIFKLLAVGFFDFSKVILSN